MYVPKKKKMNRSCGLTIRLRLVNRMLERVLETIQIRLKVSVYNDVDKLCTIINNNCVNLSVNG